VGNSNPFLNMASATGFPNPLTAWSAIPGFSQPILPGWTINIDSNNSTSPRTEGLIVSKFSYGRQLGQIGDALAAIIATLPAETTSTPGIERFLAMKKSIDVLKAGNLEDRVGSLAAELRAMKQSNRTEFSRVAEPLRGLV
jgi:hypothetical protein